MRWAGHVACMGESRGLYRVLVGKPERMRTLGKSRHRWEDNIKMDLQEVVFLDPSVQIYSAVSSELCMTRC